MQKGGFPREAGKCQGNGNLNRSWLIQSKQPEGKLKLTSTASTRLPQQYNTQSELINITLAGKILCFGGGGLLLVKNFKNTPNFQINKLVAFAVNLLPHIIFLSFEGPDGEIH